MSLPQEPKTFSEAVIDPKWVEAMQEEMASIHKNHTWDLVELPSGKSIVSNKWVYTIKCKADGTPQRYKARLVARGYEQQHGIDYEETFAPVVKWGTIRTLVALAAFQGWKLFHMDVITAFLNGDLEGEVYISQPQGFVLPGQEHLVCRLRKALYGLKQAPRAWYAKIDTYLKNQGFTKAAADSNLYVITHEDKILILVLYVDDLLFTGNCSQWIDWFKSQLKSMFEMSELGEGNITKLKTHGAPSLTYSSSNPTHKTQAMAPEPQPNVQDTSTRWLKVEVLHSREYVCRKDGT